MNRFNVGDRVRVDIPDETDPDFEEFHGQTGEIVDVTEDDLGNLTGDERDSTHYLVDLDEGGRMQFRWRDLRPAGQTPE